MILFGFIQKENTIITLQDFFVFHFCLCLDIYDKANCSLQTLLLLENYLKIPNHYQQNDEKYEGELHLLK